MDTEVLHTFGFHDTKCLGNLFFGHTVFRITRIVHDSVAHFKISAWIETAAHSLRKISYGFFHGFNMSNIIQVNDSSKFFTQREFIQWCVVGRKHNVMSSNPNSLGQKQLCF